MHTRSSSRCRKRAYSSGSIDVVHVSHSSKRLLHSCSRVSVSLPWRSWSQSSRMHLETSSSSHFSMSSRYTRVKSNV